MIQPGTKKRASRKFEEEKFGETSCSSTRIKRKRWQKKRRRGFITLNKIQDHNTTVFRNVTPFNLVNND
jgi:hypothetical protein